MGSLVNGKIQCHALTKRTMTSRVEFGVIDASDGISQPTYNVCTTDTLPSWTRKLTANVTNAFSRVVHMYPSACFLLP